jgi:PEP-CTERM motif-containing protein
MLTLDSGFTSVVIEPATLALFGAALILGARRLRRK